MTRVELQRSVKQIVAQVVTLAKPQRVILFGSAADGHAGPGSDLDFMIVVSDDRDIGDITDRLNTGIRSKPMPCDFVVVTPSILRKHRDTPGLIYGEVLARGRQVYAD